MKLKSKTGTHVSLPLPLPLSHCQAARHTQKECTLTKQVRDDSSTYECMRHVSCLRNQQNRRNHKARSEMYKRSIRLQ
jgi:hypothetical protein